MNTRPTQLTTSTVLLEALRTSNDDAAWYPFVERYRPVIERFARRAGATAEAARDVAQNAMMEFVASYRAGGYQRERGRLRDWLFGIAHHCVSAWARGQARANRQERLEADAAEEIAAEEERSMFEREWREELMRTALRRVLDETEERTREAFDRAVLRGEPVESVAADVGLTSNAIYLAKRRVLARLRKSIEELDAEW